MKSDLIAEAFDPMENKSKNNFRQASPAILTISIILGFVWNLLAVWLMGGNTRDVLRPSFLLAGALAGLAGGYFTVWSMQKRQGKESIFWGIVTYYLGMITYWFSWVVVERFWLCWNVGGWTDFDLHDHLELVLLFLFYGTFCYGILLIPLCFFCRYLVWRIHQRFSNEYSVPN